MKFVGAHVSSAGGVQNAPLNAWKIGAKAFALFTANQRQWKAKSIDAKTCEAFRVNCEKYGYSPDRILPHDGYLINLGHPEADGLEKSRQAFFDEFERCALLGLTMVNFHPGSHLGKISEEACLKRIAESINLALDRTPGVMAVIENTAGQGTNVGYRFEHIAEIVRHVEDKNRVGACLDTCHSYVAGYDLKTPEGYQKTMDTFDQVVGLGYLKAMHLNDAKKNLGSRVDRHESIGKGSLGNETFTHVMNDSRLEGLPLILETPDSDLWAEEIQALYRLVKK